MKYRSRDEIVVQILKSAKEVEGVTKTKILFDAYLSHAQLQVYLKLLRENAMLEQTLQNKYRTTEKGMKVLETFRQINELASDDRD